MSDEGLLMPGEVAAKLRVNPRTLSRWAQAGRIAAVSLPGGHRRYRVAEVDRILATGLPPADPKGVGR